MLRAYITIALAFVLNACEATSTIPADAGLCSLNCSEAIIGPVEGVILAQNEGASITCSAPAANEPLSDPFTYYWVLSDQVPDPANPEVTRTAPIPTVSIEPVISGSMSELEQHNPNVVIDGTTFTPARYKGIITPKTNWCSDACGVITIEVFPVCPPQGQATEVVAQVHSGALFSEAISAEITTEEEGN